MKKIIVLLVSLCLVWSLAGCEGTKIFAQIKDFDLPAYLSKEVDWESTEIDEPTLGSPYKHYFARLGNKEKQAYNNILEDIESMPPSIEIPSLSQEELNRVFEALLYDNPYLFFLGRTCSVTAKGLKSFFNADYVMGADEYNLKKQTLARKADEILAANSAKDQFHTELFIHDYVIDNCSYSYSGVEDESNAYGALIDNSAACEGYSKATKLLLDLAGIESYLLSGRARNYQGGFESHMWNIVNINDDYYHLDVTWDDPVTLGKDEESEPIYTYFNITDQEILKTHDDFFLENPCTAIAENYFVKKDLFFYDYNQSVENNITKRIV
ncbi:MAG TPA: transglutaminase domain-containing protein, partial [Clostridia bacterium]|nr:transglutaminase domain-containing protein [Clostridia bacterium]